MKFNIRKHVLVLLWVAVLPLGLISAQGSNSIWEGIYTDAQAERGAEEYAARCASCHAADLRGDSNSPSLLGMSFMFIWEGRTLGELFGQISTEMPTDQPGSLSSQSYAAILAFILQSNEFPAGGNELASNAVALEQFTISSP
jgi:mono/diheme cytochrome c family protein